MQPLLCLLRHSLYREAVPILAGASSKCVHLRSGRELEVGLSYHFLPHGILLLQIRRPARRIDSGLSGP